MATTESLRALCKRRNVSVVYSSTYADESIALLELSPDLEKALRDGADLSFKGGANEEGMVMCTSNKTFDVKRVESSNTTLIAVPESSNDENNGDATNAGLTVVSNATCTYEALPTHPRVDCLYDIVRANPFTFEDCSGREMKRRRKDSIETRPTMDALRSRLQASEAEIRFELERLGAIEIDNYWSMIDEKCVDEAFNHLIFSIDENQWSLENLPVKTWVDAFAGDGVDAEARSIVARSICARLMSDADEKGISYTKLSVFRALQILEKDPQKIWPVEAFVSEWQSRLPVVDDAESSVDWLRGHVLFVEQKSKSTSPFENSSSSSTSTPCLRLFPLRKHEIAPTAEKRFEQLFAIQTEWSIESLRPFVEDLWSSRRGVTEADVLVKYTRAYGVGETRKYFKR